MIYQYQVSELLNNIRLTLTENFPILDVVGEISDVNLHSKSGHLYFSLKDKDGAISCTCWKNLAFKFYHLIVEGQSVKIRGKLSSYPTSSKFYLNTLEASVYGIGEINQNFNELKQKLHQEGLFDLKKKIITLYPDTIGLITSLDGAVISDIRATLQTKFFSKLIIYNAPVQGKESVNKIVEGIEFFNSHKQKLSFLIIARGGGSVEDLYHFNEEKIVRAIANSKIPIVTAIGHEPNSTLSDLVADKWVITPTAAVAFLPERSYLKKLILTTAMDLQILSNSHIRHYQNQVALINKSLVKPYDIIKYLKSELSIKNYNLNKNLIAYKQSAINKLNQQQRRFAYLYNSLIENKSLNIRKLNNKLISPTTIIYKKNLQLAAKFNQLEALPSLLYTKSKSLQALERLVETLSFKQTLKRGFSIISQNEKIIGSSQDLTEGDYKIQFFDKKKAVKIIPK
ncbi:Exodeoxyribonuclease VII large subunit [Candidatus Hepatincolaceae symbiont of Richtersius coronifer]